VVFLSVPPAQQCSNRWSFLIVALLFIDHNWLCHGIERGLETGRNGGSERGAF